MTYERKPKLLCYKALDYENEIKRAWNTMVETTHHSQGGITFATQITPLLNFYQKNQFFLIISGRTPASSSTWIPKRLKIISTAHHTISYVAKLSRPSIHFKKTYDTISSIETWKLDSVSKLSRPHIHFKKNYHTISLVTTPENNTAYQNYIDWASTSKKPSNNISCIDTRKQDSVAKLSRPLIHFQRNHHTISLA